MDRDDKMYPPELFFPCSPTPWTAEQNDYLQLVLQEKLNDFVKFAQQYRSLSNDQEHSLGAINTQAKNVALTSRLPFSNQLRHSFTLLRKYQSRYHPEAVRRRLHNPEPEPEEKVATFPVKTGPNVESGQSFDFSDFEYTTVNPNGMPVITKVPPGWLTPSQTGELFGHTFSWCHHHRYRLGFKWVEVYLDKEVCLYEEASVRRALAHGYVPARTSQEAKAAAKQATPTAVIVVAPKHVAPKVDKKVDLALQSYEAGIITRDQLLAYLSKGG